MIPREDIRQIKFRIQECNLATGMPSRLFIQVAGKDGPVLELLNSRYASFAGHLDSGEKVFVLNTWIERIEIRPAGRPGIQTQKPGEAVPP